jgi:hypothetical protein
MMPQYAPHYPPQYYHPMVPMQNAPMQHQPQTAPKINYLYQKHNEYPPNTIHANQVHNNPHLNNQFSMITHIPSSHMGQTTTQNSFTGNNGNHESPDQKASIFNLDNYQNNEGKNVDNLRTTNTFKLQNFNSHVANMNQLSAEKNPEWKKDLDGYGNLLEKDNSFGPISSEIFMKYYGNSSKNSINLFCLGNQSNVNQFSLDNNNFEKK